MVTQTVKKKTHMPPYLLASDGGDRGDGNVHCVTHLLVDAPEIERASINAVIATVLGIDTPQPHLPRVVCRLAWERGARDLVSSGDSSLSGNLQVLPTPGGVVPGSR